MAATKTIEDIKALRERMKAASGDKSAELDKTLQSLAGESAGRGGGGRRGPGGPDSLASVSGALMGLMQNLQEADVPPNMPTIAAIAKRRAALKTLMTRWDSLKAQAAAE
jgi:hypothetical protein